MKKTLKVVATQNKNDSKDKAEKFREQLLNFYFALAGELSEVRQKEIEMTYEEAYGEKGINMVLYHSHLTNAMNITSELLNEMLFLKKYKER